MAACRRVGAVPARLPPGMAPACAAAAAPPCTPLLTLHLLLSLRPLPQAGHQATQGEGGPWGRHDVAVGRRAAARPLPAGAAAVRHRGEAAVGAAGLGRAGACCDGGFDWECLIWCTTGLCKLPCGVLALATPALPPNQTLAACPKTAPAALHRAQRCARAARGSAAPAAQAGGAAGTRLAAHLLRDRTCRAVLHASRSAHLLPCPLPHAIRRWTRCVWRGRCWTCQPCPPCTPSAASVCR